MLVPKENLCMQRVYKAHKGDYKYTECEVRKAIIIVVIPF